MRQFQTIVLLQSLIVSSAFVHQLPGTTKYRSETGLLSVPEPLAQEGTWQAFLDDETTGLVYYFDTETGESLWEPPTTTFPEVRLPRKKQRFAEELRRLYRRARQQEIEQPVAVEDTSVSNGADEKAPVVAVGSSSTTEEFGNGLPSWIEGLLEVKEKSEDDGPTPFQQVTEVAKKVVEVEEKIVGGIFNFVFGDKSKAEIQQEDVAIVEEPVLIETEVEQLSTKKDEKPGFFSVFEGITKGMGQRVEATTIEIQEEKTSPVKEVQKQPVPEIVDITPKPIKIEMGSHVLPHPAKVRWGGEDAVFYKGRTFGVFDGVSGAEKRDGVPLYSRTLAEEMKKVVGTEGLSVQQITKILTDAANYADDSATGASTAVVASIGENGFLQALNVGDSLCMVVRNGKVVAKTREISHYWECPYQLSDDSPDRPRDGTKLNVELLAGDLIIMGSDGIFDNIGDDMLLDLVAKSTKLKPTQLSKKICDLSRKQSLDERAVTPYGKQAQRRGDPTFKNGLGGKLDDACCIVVACK